MKNKSKLKRIKEGSRKPSLPNQWFYLCPAAIGVRELKEALEDHPGIELELWETAGVLEIVIPEKRSMDVEQIPVDLRDEYSNAFLMERGTQSLFAVTIDPENAACVTEIMDKIVTRQGGCFCGDTPDFTPVRKKGE